VERDDGDLALETAFAANWRDRMVEIRGDEAAHVQALADLLGTDVDRTEIRVIEPVCFGRANSTQIGQWPSRAALVADVTAARALEDAFPGWDERDFREQGVLLNSLRLFLEACPDCDGEVALQSNQRVDCCGNVEERYAMECESCGTPLL
jgi:hypothetical protein